MIMKNIKINILDFCGNNHWHYEILIDGKRFISGWYQYDLPYKYHNSEHFPNGATEYQIKKLNNKYGLVEFICRTWATCFTQEAIDLVTQKIYELYNEILNK